MEKKRVSIRAAALAAAFMLAFTPLEAYAGDGEPGQKPASQTGEGEIQVSGSGGDLGETSEDNTPDNPGEEDSPGDNSGTDSPDEGGGEPESPENGKCEGLFEPENSQANTAMPLNSPISPASDSNTISNISDLESEINKIIKGSDKDGAIILNINGGTAELANTVTPNRITENTEIRLKSHTPLVLTVDSCRHFSFNIDSGATLTLNLDGITLEGGNNRGGIETTGSGALSLQSGRVTNCLYNSASGDAGAGVYAMGDVTISGNVKITGNKAPSGGGLFAMGDVTISSGEITGNKAINDGGGLFAWGDVTISSGEITGNEATNGGGFYTRGNVTISGNIKITGNKAHNDGGFYAMGDVTISSGEITGNEATNGGGFFTMGDVTISSRNHRQ